MMLSNRKARHDYELLDTFEAGVSLRGSEIKSLRAGGGSLAEAFVTVKNGEAFVEGMTIPGYVQASYNDHEPDRVRKLLLHKREIAQLEDGLRKKGLTCVPTKMYLKNGRAKIEVALARGKKRHDKRRAEAEKDAKRRMERWDD